MELELKRPNRASIAQRQRAASVKDIPLGTADWHRFPAGGKPTFTPGDIFVGRALDGHPIGIKDQGHITVLAQTRFGKGAGIVVPNLITWPGSVVVIDIKGENAILTARRRGNGSRYASGMGQRVLIIDPHNEVRTSQDDFSDLKASFNPLDMLGPDRPESVDDAARIAAGAIDTDVSVSDPFWNESARTLIQMVCLHVCAGHEFGPEERNLLTVRDLILEGYAELRSFLADNLDPASMPSAYGLLFRAMRKNPAFNKEVAKAGAKFERMHDNSPRMLESIAQVACTALDFLASDAMQAAVAKSSFSLSDLKTDPCGVSLYLCLPQRFMDTHYRFFRMMIALLIAEMERVRHQPKSGHPILMVLDEFAGLKRMPALEHSCAQIASFGVHMMFVVQHLGQFKQTYKENFEFALANSTTRIFFGNQGESAEYVSKLLGEIETVRRTRSESSSRGTSNSHAIGHTIGMTSGTNTGQTSSWSTGPQGMSASSTSSSGWSNSTSASQSNTNTFGRNSSQTSGSNESLHKRNLLSPYEVTRFFSNNADPMALVLLSGEQPLAVRRVSYFNDVLFEGLYGPHPDHAPPPTLTQLQAIRARRKQEKIAAEERAKAKARAESKERYRKADIELQKVLERYRVEFAEQHREKLERERRERRELLDEWLNVLAGGITFCALALIIIGILR